MLSPYEDGGCSDDRDAPVVLCHFSLSGVLWLPDTPLPGTTRLSQGPPATNSSSSARRTAARTLPAFLELVQRSSAKKTGRWGWRAAALARASWRRSSRTTRRSVKRSLRPDCHSVEQGFAGRRPIAALVETLGVLIHLSGRGETIAALPGDDLIASRPRSRCYPLQWPASPSGITTLTDRHLR